MPLTAFLITWFSAKKLYMAGIGGFIVGLLLSIFTGNFWKMTVGRVLQDCGKLYDKMEIKKIFLAGSVVLVVSNLGMGIGVVVLLMIAVFAARGNSSPQ